MVATASVVIGVVIFLVVAAAITIPLVYVFVLNKDTSSSPTSTVTTTPKSQTPTPSTKNNPVITKTTSTPPPSTPTPTTVPVVDVGHSLLAINYSSGILNQYDTSVTPLAPTSTTTLSFSSQQSATNQQNVAIANDKTYAAVSGVVGVSFIPLAKTMTLPFTLASASTPPNPRQLVAAPSGSLFYQVCQDGIYVYDGATKTFLSKVVPTGMQASGFNSACIHPNNTYLYLITQSGGHFYTMPLPLVSTSITDQTAHNTLPNCVAYHTATNSVWVCQITTGILTQYDATTGATPNWIQDVSINSGAGRPRWLVFNSTGTRGYIIDSTNSCFYVFNFSVNPPTLLNTLTGLSASMIFCSISSDDTTVYVTNNNANTITPINVSVTPPVAGTNIATTGAVAGVTNF